MSSLPMVSGGIELHEYKVRASGGTITLPTAPKFFVAVYSNNSTYPSYNNSNYGCFYDVVNKQRLISQYIYISDVTDNIITYTADQGIYWRILYA